MTTISDQSTPPDLANQQRLVRALMAQLRRGEPDVALYETHISWVIAAGDRAYKFKKALRLDFVDFSALASRRHYCEQELRLNRRMAPGRYLEVVAIDGSADAPVIAALDQAKQPIDYAVKMRRFAQGDLWSARLARDQLGAQEIDALAKIVAAYHVAAAIAPQDSPWGTFGMIQSESRANLDAIVGMLDDAPARAKLARLAQWLAQQESRLQPLFASRKAGGWIRECHGDLHCGNILTADGQVEVFDCIEFADRLRWIDVMHDVAFACMDLQERGRPALAARLLNGYLEATGDYAGLAVLPYYIVQRALVRCKVGLLRAHQNGTREGVLADFALRYLDYAQAASADRAAAITITHGFSGSGKSTFCRHLVESLGAIQIRSDVERKRMRGLAPDSRGNAPVGEGLYASAATQATYDRMRELARTVAQAGYPVVADASFLQRSHRDSFKALAKEMRLPFFLFDIRASEQAMRSRLELRAASGGDASDADGAVLAHQLRTADPLSDEEIEYAIVVDGALVRDAEAMGRLIAPLTQRLTPSDCSIGANDASGLQGC